MTIVIKPVEFDPNDIDICYNMEDAKELGNQLIKTMMEDIQTRCEKHKFPLLHQTQMIVTDKPFWKKKQDATLVKLNELRQRSYKKLEGSGLSGAILSIDAMFKVVIDYIEKGLDGFHVIMLSVEGVQLMNQISACSNGEELIDLISTHPIFPFGKE